MKRKITRLARGAKCGGRGINGSAAEPGSTLAVTWSARASSPRRAASANPPKPALLVRSISRREKARFQNELQCKLEADFTGLLPYRLIQVNKLVRSHKC